MTTSHIRVLFATTDPRSLVEALYETFPDDVIALDVTPQPVVGSE